MANNYRVESTKFFNSQTGKDDRAWATAAASYYRQIGSSDKTNFVDAMAEYYAKVNAGTIAAPVTLTSTQAVVSNAGTVAVRNSAGADSHNATAVVASGAITGVNLAATVAMVDSADTIALQNSTGTVAGGNAVVTVAAGVPTNVRAPATTAVVPTAFALTGVTPSGTYTNTVTFTVAGGVITAIVLS